MNADRRSLNRITEKIIGCAHKVANVLGSGFLEKVYENAPAIVLTNASLFVERQKPIAVTYDGQIVGGYLADLLGENSVLVDLKAVKSLDEIHMAQCLNHLKAANLTLCRSSISANQRLK